MTYEVIFGSNVLMDCEGKVYVVEGSSNEENIIFSESDDGKILLNCAVKDKKGNTQKVRTPRASFPASMSSTTRNPSSGFCSVTSSSSMSLPDR